MQIWQIILIVGLGVLLIVGIIITIFANKFITSFFMPKTKAWNAGPWQKKSAPKTDRERNNNIAVNAVMYALFFSITG